MDARSPFTGLLTLALLVGLPGCGDDSTGPGSTPAALTVTPVDHPLLVGSSVSLGATVLDGSGRTMTGVEVGWASRDTTTVTVSASGTATAVRMGEGWVVARAGSLSDSLLVDVRHALAPGEARIRVRGRETFEVAYLQSIGLFADFLGRDDADFFQTLSLNASADTVLGTVQPGGPVTGVTELPDFPLEILLEGENGLDLSGALAYVLLEGDRGAPILLASASPSRLETEVESAPPGPGTRDGLLTARIVSELRRYRLVEGIDGLDLDLLPGRDTLYADVRPAFIHWGVGNSAGHMTGGPNAGEWELRETWWNGPFGGFHELDVEDGPPDILVVTPLAREGSVPVAPTESADESSGLRARVSTDPWSSERASSVSGTFTITRYVEATDDLFGEVVGMVQAELVGTDPATGEPVPLELEFEYHAPILSPGAHAVSGPGALDAGPVGALLRRLGFGPGAGRF